MKFQNLLLAVLLSGFLTACVSSDIAWKTDKKIKSIEIGMDKAQVINILGNKYMIVSSSKDHLGNAIEVLGYKSDVSEEYKLRFVNSVLTEWNREHVMRYVDTSAN